MKLMKPQSNEGLWHDNSLASTDSRTQSSKKQFQQQIEFWAVKSYGLVLLVHKWEQRFFPKIWD